MIEYIELAAKFISLLSSDDIKKMFSMEELETFEIWGNYNVFIKSLENPRSEMCRIRNIYINNHIMKQLNMNMYLIGKISRWRLYKRYWLITKTLWIYRTDLSVISWLQLLFAKVLTVLPVPNRSGLYEHRVEFVSISNVERESIIRYIFLEERKRRKREIHWRWRGVFWILAL